MLDVFKLITPKILIQLIILYCSCPDMVHG